MMLHCFMQSEHIESVDLSWRAYQHKRVTTVVSISLGEIGALQVSNRAWASEEETFGQPPPDAMICHSSPLGMVMVIDPSNGYEMYSTWWAQVSPS